MSSRQLMTGMLGASLAVSLWAFDSPAPNRREHDHLTDHNWQLEIEGVTQGAFANVSGLDSETEIIEYQDGEDIILRKRPGRTKTTPIKLVGPWTPAAKGVLDWKSKQGAVRRTVKLSLNESVSQKGKMRKRCAYTLHEATVQTARVETVKKGKTTVKRLVVVLKPTKLSNDCAELFKHPKDCKKPATK